MIELYNWQLSNIPNIYHFQGVSQFHYKPLFDKISQQRFSIYPGLMIITTASNPDISPLIQQLNINHIPFINTYRPSFYTEWDNRMKVSLIYKELNNLPDNMIVIILDGYDTAINHLDDIIYKFKQSGKKILYNGSKHNYPDLIIDRYPKRDYVGEFRYFNAGCCIGYVKNLRDFYGKCLEYKDIANPWDSEQYIIRHAWALYSEDDNSIIGIDHDCNIFQTMGSTRMINENNKYKIV